MNAATKRNSHLIPWFLIKNSITQQGAGKRDTEITFSINPTTRDTVFLGRSVLPENEYAINNPILFVDPNGNFPYPIHIRAFAPFTSFGGGFMGDIRGWSTSLGLGEGGNVTSRVQQTFSVDPSEQSVSGIKTWSNGSFHPLLGTETGTPKTRIQAGYRKDGNNNIAVVTSNMAGNLALLPGSSDIDTHSLLRLTENTKTGNLNVQMLMTGDQFPAAEAFIGDSKNQQVFIGVSGYAAGGPFINLPGNNDLPMIYINFDIKINSQGEFQSVTYRGKTYSIDDWNNKVAATPLARPKNKNYQMYSPEVWSLYERFPRVVDSYGDIICGGWQSIEEASNRDHSPK